MDARVTAGVLHTMNKIAVAEPSAMVLMDAVEAGERTVAIRQSVAEIRSNLYEMYAREGWRALDYRSWHSYLVSEFSELSHSYLRRQTHAALLEVSLSNGESLLGKHPESHLRPLHETLGGDKELMTDAYHLARDRYEEPDAVDYQVAAYEVWVFENAPVRVQIRLHEGDIGVRDAYALGRLVNDIEDPTLRRLSCEVSDPRLVPILARLQTAGSNTWDEIAASGTIPSLREPIPLRAASADTLLAALEYASNEHRLGAVVDRQVQDERRLETILEVLDAMRFLMTIDPNQWAISGPEWKPVSVAISDAMAATLKHDEVKDE